MRSAAIAACKNPQEWFTLPAANRATGEDAAMEPEWGDFKVLLALAGAGSVAGAARELQVDHSTVSRRLAALEEAVGAKLVIRGGREFNLTAEGRCLLAAAESMQSAAAQATRSVRSAKAEVEGTVRVSLAPGFVPILIRLMLPALREAHPALNVELRGDYQRVDLAKGEADVAVRMARPSETDLVGRRAFDCGWCVYASRAYLDAKGRPESNEALALHRLVLYAESMHANAPLRWMEPYKGPAHQVSRLDNLEIVCQAIAADAGIAVLPCFIGDPVASLERVFRDPVAVNTGWIIYHETVRDAARIRAVVDALVAFFQCHEAMFAGTAAGVA
jgi:DNA-binding transcriptional LysR family regulator